MQGQHEGKTVRGGTEPVRAKRYRTGTGKTIRDRYGQIGTGPARAKQYGNCRGKTVRAHTGYGAGAVRDTVWARYAVSYTHLTLPTTERV